MLERPPTLDRISARSWNTRSPLQGDQKDPRAIAAATIETNQLIGRSFRAPEVVTVAGSDDVVELPAASLTIRGCKSWRKLVVFVEVGAL